MVTAMNNDKTLCGCFGMHPSFVAGILNSARRVHFFVLCNEELKYVNYIEKCIDDKECSVCYMSHTGHYFQLSYQSETIFISFEARLFPKLPSEIIFAQGVLKKKIQLGCLAYAIVGVKGRVTCITNEVISSWHDCVFKACFCEFDSPIRLANCKAYMQYCPLHQHDTCLYQILHSSQKSRSMYPSRCKFSSTASSSCICVKNDCHRVKTQLQLNKYYYYVCINGPGWNVSQTEIKKL